MQNKLLIAVTTCHRFDYDMRSIDQCMVLYREGMDFKTFRPPIIRETWWNDVPVTVGKKFFYGRPVIAGQDDEVFLDVPDDYAHLPYKTRAICQWAIDHGYYWLLKADDDSFLYVDRFLKSGFELEEWIGRYNGGNFVAGGPAYALNRYAMAAVAAAPIPKQDWAEDIWVSKTLINAGFKPHWDDRYVDLRRGQVTADSIAVCECTRDTMRLLYDNSRQG